MNIQELKDKLLAADIPECEYSLSGGLPSEAFCIERVAKGVWRTYYSERGIRSVEKMFESEEEACEDFWRRFRQAR